MKVTLEKEQAIKELALAREVEAKKAAEKQEELQTELNQQKEKL